MTPELLAVLLRYTVAEAAAAYNRAAVAAHGEFAYQNEEAA